MGQAATPATDISRIEVPPPEPYTVLCTYLPRADKVERMRELLQIHWPALRRHNLVTDDPPIIYSGEDASGPFFVEILTWRDRSASGRAYWTEEINDIWSEFYAYCEERGSRPGIEYPKVNPLPCAPADQAMPRAASCFVV